MKIWRSTDVSGERYVQKLETRWGAAFAPGLNEKVAKVVSAVAKRGDRALAEYVRRVDLEGLDVSEFKLKGRVTPGEEVGDEFVEAVEVALKNLRLFHEPQLPKGYTLDRDGSELGIRVRPLDAVGVYVPGGAAAYLSSLLMAVVPARIAGVRRIAVATPPRAFLTSPQLRYLLDRLELREVYLMGGAHAVAALAFGTESVAPVDKIVGPGGRWVSAAKRAVFGVVGVDLIGGPSELVVLADGQADAAQVSADLLAQAEHDPEALAVLITTSRVLAEKVDRRMTARVRRLPKKAAAREALKSWGGILLVRELEGGADLVNRIAPEHVELLVAEPRQLLDRIDRVGAVYLGPWSPAVLGDYSLGSNHVLPTAGAAKFASPLGVWDFVRRTVIARVAAHQYGPLARAAAALAAVEQLPLHEEALTAGGRGTV
jgi:histidinol dehydrogenase